MKMLRIDGSAGEGGGQVVRSSLALAIRTQTPIEIDNIRARRSNPGLRRQHLTAVRAAAQICDGKLQGDSLGSRRIRFVPGDVRCGEFRFAVGTAGSTTLVLQTVLPVLLTAPEASRLILQGGTHNPMAPPYPYLISTFLPLVRRMGPEVDVELVRPGFYPAGGGELRVDIKPRPQLAGLDLMSRGEVRRRRGTAWVARLPRHVGERELAAVRNQSGWATADLRIETCRDSHSPGNLLALELVCDHLTETFIGFGQRGVSAEQVATSALVAAEDYLRSGAAVGEYLADQLLLLLAIAGQGSFLTIPLSGHSLTQVDLIGRFLPVPIQIEAESRGNVSVRIG